MRQNWAAPVFHQPAVRVQQNIAQTLHTHYKHSLLSLLSLYSIQMVQHGSRQDFDPLLDISYVDWGYSYWVAQHISSLCTILTWCVQFVLLRRYSLQLLVWRGRDQFSYKPSSFIFQPLRRGLIQFTISFGSHFAFYLKHGTEFENELKEIIENSIIQQITNNTDIY